MVLPYVASGKAAAVLVSLMRFVGGDRRVSMPRALIAEDTGLTEKQVKDAIRSLKRTAVPDPDTGEAVLLLEVLKDGHNGAATEYRLNVSNVDAVPWGYEVAARGGMLPAAPTMPRDGKGAEPAAPTMPRDGKGVATVTKGVATKHGRGGACHPLRDKEIEREIREGWNGESGEWDGQRLYRAKCPVCGEIHPFLLKDFEFGTAACPNLREIATAPPPDGYRIAAQGDTYVLEWLGDGRA